MSNLRYTPDQIFEALVARDSAVPISTISQKLGCSEGTIGMWRQMYKGHSRDEIAVSRLLVDPVSRIKIQIKLLSAERKVWILLLRGMKLSLLARMKMLGEIQASGLISTMQARQLLGMRIPKLTTLYERDDAVVVRLMKQHFAEYPAHGFPVMFNQILKGKVCGQTRAQRLYADNNLQLHIRRQYRSSPRFYKAMTIPEQSNEVWSMDFMHLEIQGRRNIRSLNVIDDFSRRCLMVTPISGATSAHVIECLVILIEAHGLPKKIRCDNGPEFSNKQLKKWANAVGTQIEHIEPYRPNQNGLIEAFNGIFRSNILRWNTFKSIEHFRLVADEFRHYYNNARPHRSLAWLTPSAYELQFNPAAPKPNISFAGGKSWSEFGELRPARNGNRRKVRQN